VFGGGTTTDTDDVQQYSFSSATHLTGAVVAHLPAKRADVPAVNVDGQIYLVGGFDGKAWVPSILGTADGMSFQTTAQLVPAVRFAAVATLNGMLYVIGGELAPNAADATAVQQINLQTGAVTALSPLAAGLSHASAVTLNNTIYVFGGRSGGHAIDTISELNPATGQLLAVGHLPAARSNMGVAVVGQTAYLLGGEDDTGKPTTSVVTVSLVPGHG
jgi:N-acetylneuraminic acid mutarotase